MKRFLQVTLFLIFPIIAYPQIKSYPLLRAVDVNFFSIRNENYYNYLLSTTQPKSVHKTIDEKYVIKNFSWTNILSPNVKRSQQLGTALNASINIREPLAEEKTNFIYFEAIIKVDLLPAMMFSKYNVPLVLSRGGIYTAKGIKNLYELDISFIPRLVGTDNETIQLGETCEVTTEMNKITDEVKFTIAVEIKERAFTEVVSGTVEMNLLGFRTTENRVIKKSDVGKRIKFDNEILEIIEFSNGVLHMRGPRINDKLNFIGNMNGEKFKIKHSQNILVNALYDKYREYPKFRLDQFLKYDAANCHTKLATKELIYKVGIFNFGYDVDSLNVYFDNKIIPASLTYKVLLSKTADKYGFTTLYKDTPQYENREAEKECIEAVRKYFIATIKYSDFANTNGIDGRVIFKFSINPKGELGDITLLSSPDKSLVDEVMKVVESKPIFNINLSQTIYAYLSVNFIQ